MERVTVKKFLLESDTNPVPLRVMYGTVVRESARGVYMKLEGHAWPSSTCCQCGRTLTHRISLYLGIGPVCSGLYYAVDVADDDIDAVVDSLRQQISAITWEGWLPKSGIEREMLPVRQIRFTWQGKTYTYDYSLPYDDKARRVRTYATVLDDKVIS